jgi:prophage regulatory protein
MGDQFLQSPDIPQMGLLRIKQILDIIHVSRSGWWEGVRKGRYPPPIKLSPRVTVWKLSDIRELCEGKNPETREGERDPRNG